MDVIFYCFLFSTSFGVVVLIALSFTILGEVRACRHNQVAILRAHPGSEFGRRHHGKHACVDAHGVLNFVQCRICKRVLTAKATEGACNPS